LLGFFFRTACSSHSFSFLFFFSPNLQSPLNYQPSTALRVNSYSTYSMTRLSPSGLEGTKPENTNPPPFVS
jgi:hypothetical protein